MKKLYLIILFAGIMIFPAFTQNVPNGGLEEWALNGLGGLDPVGWITLNDDGFTNVFQIPGYSGEHAAKLSVEWDPVLEMFMGSMFFVDGNFPVSERFTAFEFYVQGTTAGSDYVSVSVGMWKQNDLLGSGLQIYSFNNANWTKVVLPIEYTSSDTPEECFIGIQVGGVQGATYGTYYIIDELMLTMNSGPSNIGTNDTISVEDMQIFPNPFPGIATITLTASEETNGEIELVDLQGRNLKTLFSGKILRGVNRYSISIPEFENGLYICRLNYGGRQVGKTIVLQK